MKNSNTCSGEKIIRTAVQEYVHKEVIYTSELLNTSCSVA